MSWLMSALYDRFMRQSEDACLGRWRAELLHDLSGSVLEIGAGTGATLPHYPASVSRLVLCEPDPHMRRKLEARAGALAPGRAEVAGRAAHALGVESASFDAVVSSLVLCSVPDQGAALAEIARVLKPRGRLVFLEHVAADGNPPRLKWQKRIEPVWKHLMDNCHLTRRTETAIGAAGFRIERIQRESIRKAMPLVRPSIRGIAVKIAA
ncbi:MAG TPA: class I SAM-dependent methyltransferase [Burkholderiales bacterium]|nr:class I SAM-dependent methyltransferase [Burkholderiales bacterium]